jgi:biopolymer transport protein ExbD/biopolymer transport protein TolR
MARAKREEGKKVNSNINVTPMVDIMLVILIIFMVITPLVNAKIPVDLPKVTAATIMENANKEDSISIGVTRDGKVFLGADPVQLDALAQKVSDLEEKKTDPAADKSVYFRADTRTNYGVVMSVIDKLREAGVSQINMLTDDQTQQQQ